MRQLEESHVALRHGPEVRRLFAEAVFEQRRLVVHQNALLHLRERERPRRDECLVARVGDSDFGLDAVVLGLKFFQLLLKLVGRLRGRLAREAEAGQLRGKLLLALKYVLLLFEEVGRDAFGDAPA